RGRGRLVVHPESQVRRGGAARRAAQRHGARAAGGSGRLSSASDVGKGAVRVGKPKGEMTMDRTYTVDELLSAVRRRWKAVAMVAGGALLIAAVVIARVPNEYKARALVMVEPFTPHPDLVIPVINAQSLEEKVKSVRSNVYARGLMATTIEELNLYPKQREKGMDEAVEAL